VHGISWCAPKGGVPPIKKARSFQVNGGKRRGIGPGITNLLC
jgi:hypothetical protein